MSYSTYVNPLNVEQLSEECLLPELNYYNLKKAAVTLRALNHKLRQQIIKTIYYNKRVTVTQLFVVLQIKQPVISLHLAILRKAGIVLVQRQGKFSLYSINDSRIKLINETVEKFADTYNQYEQQRKISV